MLTPLLIAVLAAGPRAPADADFAAYIPKLGATATYAPFFNRAGERSVILRPSAWREDFHPLLSIELTRTDDLVRAGLDLLGSATVSTRGEFVFTCVSLADPTLYEQKCLQRISTLGQHFRVLKDGVVRVGAKDTLGRVLAGYVIKGKESCAVRGHGRSVEPMLDEAAKLLGKNATGLPWKLAEGLPGALVMLGKNGVVALRGTELSLQADGKSKGLPNTGLLGAGPSPFGAANPEGLSTVRMRGDRTRLYAATDIIVRALLDICQGCEKAPLDETVKALTPHLGGNALGYAREVQVRGTLRTLAGRYFALKNAMLADLTNEKAAREALSPLLKLYGVKPLPNGEGVLLTMKEGEVRIGVRGKFLYLSNDERALEVAFKAAARGEGVQAHGVEVRVDTRKLARALAQVPLLDALGSQDLAGMVMVAGELGPLLLSSERISGWVDPTSTDTARGHLEWILSPVEPKPDAGIDGGAVDAGLDGGFEAVDGGP